MTSKRYRNREQTRGNIHIDRQTQTEGGRTKYTEESGLMGWKQVKQMKQDAEREADEGVSSGVQTRGSWEV